MRLLKILLTGLFALFALIAGLFIAAVGALALVIGRLVGGPNRNRPNSPARGEPQRSPRANAGDVIDITATEVPADSWQK